MEHLSSAGQHFRTSRNTDAFELALKNLRETYAKIKEDLYHELAEERRRGDELAEAVERLEAEKRELAGKCDRQQRTLEEFREWSEAVLHHTATTEGRSPLPAPPDISRDSKTERGWLRKSPVFEKEDVPQATQRSVPASRRRHPQLLHTPEGAVLATPLAPSRQTIATTPYKSEDPAEVQGKTKTTATEPSPSLRVGSIQRLLKDMDEKMEWRADSQSSLLHDVGSPRRLKTNTVTDEETTEHDDEGEAERPRRGSARKFSEEAPTPSKATKEEDHLLSPTNFLKRMVPTTPKPSLLKAPTGVSGKAGDDEEEEDSMESVYSMFLGDDKRSPTSEQKVTAPVEVEVESSSGEHLYSDEASEERGKKGSSDTSEVEIIDVDALPARKGASKRKKAQTRREPGNKADATPGFRGRKRQRTTIADIQQELEERDNDAAVSGSASRFRSRQRAVDRRKSASTAKPEVRPHFDADVDDDDEYSTVFVGGSSEEEREAERTRKTDRRRKEADDLRAFRVLLKEGAIDPPQDEEGDATGNESQRPGKLLRGEGETPGRPTPLLRLPYAMAPDALRAGGERKERITEYARVEVVRKKDERAVLPGHECEECAKFYDAIREGGLDFDRKLFVNNCSRHRSAYAAPDTPPHFWDLSFPETQPGTPPRDDGARP